MAVSKGAENWKSKKWFNIYAPQILGSNNIGEMPANDEKAVIGRVIKVSMPWITNNPSHSFMLVGLKVTEADGNSAHTQLKYIEQTYSYLHSLVRRHSSIIYTVDKITTQDAAVLTIKLMLTTRSKVTTPKKKAMRTVLSDFVKGYAASKDKEAFVKELLDGTFQSECTKKIKNIAEINKLELKKLEL